MKKNQINLSTGKRLNNKVGTRDVANFDLESLSKLEGLEGISNDKFLQTIESLDLDFNNGKSCFLIASVDITDGVELSGLNLKMQIVK